MSALSFTQAVHMVNCHNTPFAKKEELEAQFAYLSRTYSPVNADELQAYVQTGVWKHARPGVIIAFYNGYRNNYDVAGPLLKRYGLTGWFFVATDFIDAAPGQQLEFGNTHTFNMIESEYSDGRYAISWEELRELQREGHEVGSHTATHSTIIQANTSPDVMHREIVYSAQRIEEQVGADCASFCWLYGEGYHYCKEAAPYLEQAGYRFLVGSRSIEYLK